MNIRKTVRLPEYQGQQFHMTGIEVLGIRPVPCPGTQNEPVVTIVLTAPSSETPITPITITPYDTDLVNDGVFKWALSEPINQPFIRYAVTAKHFDVRAINLLGYVTESTI